MTPDRARNASGRPPKTDDEDLVERLLDITASAAVLIPATGVWAHAAAIANFGRSAYALNEAVQKDAFVGTFDLIDGCYQAAGPHDYELRDDYWALSGSAKLNFVGDAESERDPICELGITLLGPSQVTKSGSTGAPTPLYSTELEHTATGVTYEWRDNGVFKTSNSSYLMSPVTVGSHVIQVKVTRIAPTEPARQYPKRWT